MKKLSYVKVGESYWFNYAGKTLHGKCTKKENLPLGVRMTLLWRESGVQQEGPSVWVSHTEIIGKVKP